MANGTKTKQEGIFVKPIPSVNWNYMSNANDQQIYTQNLDRLIKRQDNKTELQKAENRDTANFYQKYYNQMNGFVKIGDKTYENNMKAFFNKKVDDYNAINTAIDKGIIDPKQGAAALSRIDQMVLDYKRLAPTVLAQALYMQENGASGSDDLSKLNDPNLIILFDKLLNGSGEVNLSEWEGGLYLTGKGKLRGPGGGDVPWEYNLNLNEFEKIIAREDAIAMTVPTMKEAGIDEIFKIFSPEAMNSVAQPTEFMLKQRQNPKSTRTSEIDYIDVNNYKQSLLNMGAFDQVLKSPEMNIIWADLLNKDKKMGDFNLWQDPNMSFEDQVRQRADAEYALAQLVIDTNIPKHLQLKYEKDGIFYDGNDQISRYNEGDYEAPEIEEEKPPSNDELRNIANVREFIETRDAKALNQTGLTFEVEGDDVTIYKAKQQTTGDVTTINPRGIALGTVDLGGGDNRAFNEIMKIAFPGVVPSETTYEVMEEEVLTDDYMENIYFEEELTADEYLKKLNKKINKGNKRTTWKEILEGSGIKVRKEGKFLIFGAKGSDNNFEYNPADTTAAAQQALRNWIDLHVNKVSNEFN